MRRFVDSPYKRVGESTTPCICETGSLRLTRLWKSPRFRSQNRNGSNGCVRDLCRTDVCKKIEKYCSLPCPRNKELKVIRPYKYPSLLLYFYLHFFLYLEFPHLRILSCSALPSWSWKYAFSSMMEPKCLSLHLSRAEKTGNANISLGPGPSSVVWGRLVGPGPFKVYKKKNVLFWYCIIQAYIVWKSKDSSILNYFSKISSDIRIFLSFREGEGKSQSVSSDSSP